MHRDPFNPSPPIEVDIPRPREPAIHLARFMPPESVSRKRRWTGITLVNGLDAPGEELHPGDLGRVLLDLPRDPELMPLSVDSRLAPGLGQLWLLESETGLTIPAHVHQDLRWLKSWNILSFASPSDIGVGVASPATSRCAWRVLERVRPEDLVAYLLALALHLDVFGPASHVEAGLLPQLGLSPYYEARLRAELRTQRPFFDPSALRWIVREICAWSVEQQEASQGPQTEAESIATDAFFARVLRANAPPTLPDVLRAVWFLHQDFHGAAVDHSDEGLDYVLALTGALSFGLRQRAGWVNRLLRADDIWNVDDSHDSLEAHVLQGPARPSTLRAAAERVLGVPVADWFKTGFLFSGRIFSGIVRGEFAPRQGDTFRLVMDAVPTAQTRIPIEEWVVSDMRRVGLSVLEDCTRQKGTYRGLGSTPQHHSIVFRKHPIVRVPQGWVPAGFDVLVDRFCDVPREAAARTSDYASVRATGGPLGIMFEAYVQDVLQRLGDRHIVVPEDELQTVLRQTRRSDALIIHGSDYVVVESSLQRTFEGVAVGNLKSVKTQCRLYAEKAQQAEATLADLSRISSALGLPRPTSATYLLVTENPMPLTSAVAQELQRLDPRRNPNFVIGIEELELAVALSARGWSLPMGVHAWQGRGLYRAFLHDLLKMANTIGLDPWDIERARRWDDNPPDTASSAA